MLNCLKTENGKMMGAKENIKRLTIKVPEKLHTEFKIAAASQKRTMAEIIEELIKEYLKKTKIK